MTDRLEEAAAIAEREAWLWEHLFRVITVKQVEECQKCTGHAVKVHSWPSGFHCACGLILIIDRWMPDGKERVFARRYEFDRTWSVRVGAKSLEHWYTEDWDFLNSLNSLDVEYFAWSNVFMEWLADNGSEEQTAKFLERRNSQPPTDSKWMTAHARSR